MDIFKLGDKILALLERDGILSGKWRGFYFKDKEQGI